MSIGDFWQYRANQAMGDAKRRRLSEVLKGHADREVLRAYGKDGHVAVAIVVVTDEGFELAFRGEVACSDPTCSEHSWPGVFTAAAAEISDRKKKGSS